MNWTQADYLAFEARQRRDVAPHGDKELDDEGKFHLQIMDFLHAQGIHGVIHSRMDRKATVPIGVPDFLFAVRGVPVALEAKVKGRKPKPEQLGWLAALQMDGWITRVVWCMADVVGAYETASSVARVREILSASQIQNGHE